MDIAIPQMVLGILAISSICSLEEVELVVEVVAGDLTSMIYLVVEEDLSLKGKAMNQNYLLH